MNKFLRMTVAVTLGLLGFSTGDLRAAAANTNAMLVQFQITAEIQDTGIATNGAVATTAYTVTSVKIGNANILNMLEAEFGTTFPAGAQLAFYLTGDNGFHVLDQNGNSIMNVATNPADSSYSFSLSNAVAGVGAPVLIIGKAVDNILTSNQTEVVTEIAPDYGIYYKDSHGNDFHVDGLLTLKANASITSSSTVYNTVSFILTGTGGGTFFNPADGKHDTGAFTKATVSAVGKDIIQ